MCSCASKKTVYRVSWWRLNDTFIGENNMII
uniref:Uncharacterized protein n=1 Tax=Rhizophora mucronata TaxID=61149 RepID=A0A2P2QFC1_RHIMU